MAKATLPMNIHKRGRSGVVYATEDLQTFLAVPKRPSLGSSEIFQTCGEAIQYLKALVLMQAIQ